MQSSRLEPRKFREDGDANSAWVPLICGGSEQLSGLRYCSGIPGSGVGAGVVADAGGFLRAFVAAAFLPAALRARVCAALRPAARRLRVVAALRAAARRLRVAAAFVPALFRLGLIVSLRFRCGDKLNRNLVVCAIPAFWRT